MAVEHLLDKIVLSAAFPNIRRWVKVYVILPFSGVAFERGFPKMNFMTKRRCSLDSVNLDALMRILVWVKKLES